MIRAAVMIALIAFFDWRVDSNIQLGFLYLFPMLLLGSVLRRWQIAGAAALCTFLNEVFDSFPWHTTSGLPRDILVFAAFFCMGLFVYEVLNSRRAERRHLDRIEQEVAARSDAEEQLRVLVESSPAAVFTTNSEGLVLLANDAAHRLFAVPLGTLVGLPIRDFLPSLANLRSAGSPDEEQPAYRTAMQCRGRRLSGEVFLADVWFSTYRTSAGSRLAAMVVDVSEDLRNREESSLHQLLAGSRILVGAVSHEIRNVCGAIAMAYANLIRGGAPPDAAANKDFLALGKLIAALEKIAAMDLRQMADQAASVDLASLLEEFRIVVEPSLEDRDIHLTLSIEPGLPAVWADRQSLLQVFLNLAKNSERAMLHETSRELTIGARADKERVTVQFRDTGCGVAHPDRLFRPFQQQAEATGLGLYLSRAFMRSFRGDLRYEPETRGSSFIVELSPAVDNLTDTHAAADPDSSYRRPQPVPGEPQPAARS
ncbi:MAG TPA: ATP-binding protein [Bryobacteraceae bacterium]|jgi:PAS domain S-box-containing protein|nr:ATP-binding protein [Bryobacteraceae bacterium]